MPIKPIFLFFFLTTTACFPFRNSPYSSQLIRNERNLNTQTLERMKIATPESDGVIRIAAFSDSHQNYDDLGKVIDQINGTAQVDFVVNLGDFTNNSFNFEYDQFLEYWTRLLAPGFTIAGNHDLLGAGVRLFEQVFGPTNFIYETAAYRFIFANTNNWEDPRGFQPGWILQAAEQSRKRVVLFAHHQLTDQERYQGETARQLQSVLDNPRTELAVCGDKHTFSITTQQEAKMLFMPRVQGVNWMLVEFYADKLAITLKPEGGLWSFPLRSP